MGFPKLRRRRMTIFNPSFIFRPRQLYLKDVGPTKSPLWSIPLSIWGSSELFMNGSLLNQLGKHEQIPPVKLPTPCYFQTNRMSQRMLGKVAKIPTNTYKNLISKISKISIISNKFTNQTSHRQQNQKPRLAWGSGFAVTVEAIFLGSAGFCKDLLRDPKDAMEFFASEGNDGFGAKVLWIPVLVPFWGCWSWFCLAGRGCPLTKGWWKKTCSNCSNRMI